LDRGRLIFISGLTASTTFDVSSKTETGLNDMEVVVNGIASAPVTVNVF
jgi:hypothetical protein